MEESPVKSPPTEVVVAETVFLLMTKEHRISKHLRAKWYLKHVNTVLEFPYTDDSIGHPQLVSVLVNGGQPLRPGDDGLPVKFKLATDTTVNFLSTHHDIVFAIDVSFSTISSSTADSEVLFDKMYTSLRECAIGLTKTFIIPGTDNMEFVPYLYATVIAHSPLNDCPVQQVLTHGYLLSHSNVGEFIRYVSLELNKFENGVANYMNSVLMETNLKERRGSANSGSGVEDEETNPISKLHLGPEKGFFHLLKNAMLAIHLLPANCSSGIILITDGSVGIGDVGRFDNLLVQLLSQSCTCSVIEVGCENNARRGLGRVPHSEMLQFIATATFGAYFTKTPSMEEDYSNKMNIYHEGILCWDFRKSIKDFLSIGPTSSSLAYESKLRKGCTEYKLAVPINCVITTRMKEGFTIKTVDASKEVIEVVMVLPWRKNVCIEYKASSCWPVPAHSPVTNVSICFEGNYHFLHDLTCKKAHIRTDMSPRYRHALVTRFWKSILSLKPIDDSLVMMQAFHTQDDFSIIPDSIQKGVALFYCSSIRNGRSLEIITHSNDATIEQFANYWKRVLCIDLGVPIDKSGVAFDRSSHIMEKWFHITRLYMVLEHDPKHQEMLNIAYAHDRFHTLQCRQASVTLTKTLREWSDFELLENSHYVKYIHRQDNDSTPISGYHAENWISFCMIMLNVKGACVSLRLTFLGGTDSIYRTRLIDELKDVVQSLHFQKRPEKASKKLSRAIRDDNHVPPLQRKWEDRQCCILMSKPLDRVIVRYERVPKTILTVDNINHDIAPMESVPSRLANYLHHQRWIWYLQPSGDVHFDSLDIKSIGNILDVLTKLRFQEGFNFSQTNSGIVSMILEVDMTNVTSGTEAQIPKDEQESLSCLVQYITFPPQRRARLLEGSSDSEGDDEGAECGELVMVTEVWIEPQHGFVANSTPERQHYEGCTFYNWPDKLFPVDERCVTLLVTIDHLLKYCSPLCRTSMSSSLVSGRQEKLSPPDPEDAYDATDRVKQIPFIFSVIELLPMCQQVETLFPTYSTASDSDSEEGSTFRSYQSCGGRKTNDILFNHMLAELDKHTNAYEMELTADECFKFMKQLQDRPRDTTEPLPFTWTTGADSALNTERDDFPFTARSDRPGVNSDSPASTLPRSVPSMMTEQAPELKCFCFPGTADKHGVVDSITLLFIPASYKDLKKMCSSATLNAEPCEAHETAKGIDKEQHIVPPLNIPQSHVGSEGEALPLPVYTYHCSHKLVIDSLLYRNRDNIKPDEYIDNRFSTQTDGNGNREYRHSYRSDRSDRSDESDKLASPTTNHRRRYRTDSSSCKRSFSRTTSVDMSSTDPSTSNLSSYCQEAFCKSFITGIFQSLRKGHDVSGEDVEFAIDICMEAGIFEIEITNFLSHVCSHMNPQPLDSSTDQVFADTAPTTPKSVKFEMPGLTPESPPSDSKKKSSSTSSDGTNRPSNLRSPVTVKVPCATLFERNCETVVSVKRIKSKFSDVIGKWFKPVPSRQDVFYYAPANMQSSQLWDYTDSSDISSVGAPADSEDADPFETCDEEVRKARISRSISDISRDSMVREVDNVKPLFVHLTASIQNERVFQSVADIPVCLCELREGLKRKESIDLANAHITLDITCLTLTSELSDSVDVKELIDQSEDQDMKNAVTPTQLNDVLECKKNMEWLVRDEIAAAMRSISPITEETLKMVADHVRHGQNENSCKYAEERLDYVFGPDMSHEMFVQEFQRINVTGYQLLKCGDYYYLSLDRARLKSQAKPFPIRNQLEDVASKLGKMNPDYPTSHCDSADMDRSIETLPTSARPSSTGSNELHSLPDPKLGSSGGYKWHLHPSNSDRSDSATSSSDGNELIDDDKEDYATEGLRIPMSQVDRASVGFDLNGGEGTGTEPLNREILLSSLPQRNQIDEWNREEDEFSSKCGSLPKAFSSCNVNIERASSERKILKRVSSGPQELHSSDCYKPKVRHVSEDTGRKKTTFAASVLSPPASAAMSMKECMELESARSRNPSGPWTPLSNRINGSTGSETSSESDPGYEADFSDEEGTAEGLSFIGTEQTTRTPQMPNLWLIMQIHSNDDRSTEVKDSGPRLVRADVDSDYRVDVFFHTSESVQPERHFSDSVKGNVPKNKLFSHVLGEIRRTCKLVNQRLLLLDLHNKRKCDVLLEENWDDELNNENRHTTKVEQTDSDPDHGSEDEYLYARTKFKQGHFKCELKWEKVFHLHPRLKSAKGKLASNRGVAALKSGLNYLKITNRSNMFVHKESQTGNIFYLRLSECNEQTSRTDFSDEPRPSDADASSAAHLSRSSSVRSLSRTREENDGSRRPSVTDNDDAQSITSSRASVVRRPPADDGIKLYVYGIDEVGSDIKIDLVKMLEARLDDAVLVDIVSLLSRNPLCMLTQHDVQFLQRVELPTTTLKLTLPDGVLHHQTAVLYYLRQNLLLPDLLYHPKYQQDSECRFMDYTESITNSSPMQDCNTFLYNKSPAYVNAEKGAGIALIYLQLVDSLDRPKHLLGCPKPDLEAWKTLDSSMFEKLTTVSKVQGDERTKSLSTSSLIRFSIWSRGDVDPKALESLLKTSLVHALCDFVCEYYAFTAPLCAPPPQLIQEMADVTAQEDKLFILNNKGGGETGPTTPTKKFLSRSKSAAASAASAFTFNTDNIKITSPPCYGSDKAADSAESTMSSKRASILTETDKYLFGEKGHLLPFYTTTLIDWLEFCSKLELPALTKVSCGLLNDCIVDPIMKEFESVVGELSGVSIQAYKLRDNKYLPYQTSRTPLPESAELLIGGVFTHLNYTYSDLSDGHILTVRNRKLWTESVGAEALDEKVKGLTTPQPYSLSSMSKSNQKFQPAYGGMEGSLSLSNSQSMFCTDRPLHPRQQFLMLVIKNGVLTLYSYNLADGKDDILKQHIILNAKKVTRWNNARFHLVNCIAHQKMGLFQHASIQDVPEERHCEERNHYTSTYDDTIQLAKSSRPVPDSLKSSARSGSRYSKVAAAQSPVAALDKVYRGSKPTRPMHLSKGGIERDPIARHGNQLIETFKNEQRDNERRKKLEKLYKNWLERIGPMRIEISEDHLDLLKQSSRLVHHIATPLLLSPHWRTRAINLPKSVEELQKMEEDNTIISQRSRNNSGASVSSVKTSADRFIQRESPISHTYKSYEEEPWHEEMRNMFVSNYTDYLGQTQQPLGQLGFTTIKIMKPTGTRGFVAHHRKHSSGGSGCEQLVKQRTTHSLQKTMPGGIFIIELSFQEVYFVVKLYVFSTSQLSINKPLQHANRNPISYFIEMCDRMRDNTHCHSFAHDFHLKAVHRYVKRCQDGFHQPSKDFHSTYHLVRMLKDFAMFYEEAPRFSRNALALQVLELDSTNNPCDKLYEHILLRDSYNQMTKITMADEPDDEDGVEHGLIYQQSNKKYGEYEVSVIIAHDHPPAFRNMAMKDKLILAYFVVLVNVNKEQQYPGSTPHARGVPGDSYLSDIGRLEKLSADSAISSTSNRQIRMFSTRWTNGPCSMAHSQERRSSDQFAEFFHTIDDRLHGQHPAYQLLMSQCNSTREKLTLLVEEASLQCRKQVLWKQMLSEQMDALSFAEFMELLDVVDRQHLSLDKTLQSAVSSMPIPWYIALTKVLSAKYQGLYREFSRADGLALYSVVLIPEIEEVAIMVSINRDSGQPELMLILLEENDMVLLEENLSTALEDFTNTLCFHMWAQMGT